MKGLKTFLNESENNERIKIEINKIYEYLSNPKFKILFKTKSIENTIMNYNEYKDELYDIFGKKLDKGNVYCVKIWNGGFEVFQENPPFNQAEVCSIANNTNNRYYILCEKSRKCTLVYYERRHMLPPIYGTPYTFNI